MLQGKSKIELFDALTGKKTFEHEEHNMITNSYKKAYETIMSKIALTDDFIYMNKLYPRDISKSILLLNSPQTEDANNFTPKGTLTGYASENGYSGSSSMRGTFNSTESVPLSNPSGYKYVWDFPTNCANGTISALTLTSSNTVINSAQSLVNLSSPNIYKTGVFSDETGDNFYNYYSAYNSSTGYTYGFTKSTLKSTIPYLSSTSRFTTITYTFPSYGSGLNNIVYYGGYVYLILRLTSDSKWYLIKSDTSGNIISTTLIGTTVPIGNYFGIVGNYAIWYSTYGTGSIILKVFNITTGTFASDLTFTYINGNTPDTFYNIGTSLMVGYSNSGNGYEILIDENLNFMKVADEQYLFPYANYSSHSGNYIGNAPMMFAGSSIYIAPFTMFTINNLATAVTKTSYNTMKISYSLTW